MFLFVYICFGSGQLIFRSRSEGAKRELHTVEDVIEQDGFILLLYLDLIQFSHTFLLGTSNITTHLDDLRHGISLFHIEQGIPTDG